MKNGIYISSLILIGISIFLLIEYPNSGRMSLIAGAMIFIGFALNIAGYVLNTKLKIPDSADLQSVIPN